MSDVCVCLILQRCTVAVPDLSVQPSQADPLRQWPETGAVHGGGDVHAELLPVRQSH